MIAQLPAKLLAALSRTRQGGTLGHWWLSLLMTSVGVTTLVIGIRQVGWLQSWELSSYDQLMRFRPLEDSDPRLLLVTITEDDIRREQNWPLKDRTFTQLLTKLEAYQPQVIGMDIYRDIPENPGYAEFASFLKRQSNIITVCLFGDDKNPKGIPPPPSVPTSRVGFSDLLPDADRIVRRSLLYAKAEGGKCTPSIAFSTILALRYLEKTGIHPQQTSHKNLQLGQTVFQKLDAHAGSYQQVDAGGYQIMLNYRASPEVAKQVTVTQVLTGHINPNWVKDRVVILGTTAESIHDDFYTPYSAANRAHPIVRGVVLHAQQVSQILSSVLDDRPLIWYWPDWIEVLWIWGWSIIGGGLVWLLRHPLRLSLSIVGALGSLGGICYGLFLQAGWVPLVPSAMALVATGASVAAYTAYQTYQKQQEILRQAQTQEETITLLTMLLKQNTQIWDEDKVLTSQVTLGEAISDLDKLTQPKPTSHFFPLLGGRYKISRTLGIGGFGQTYLAEDTQRPGNPACVVKQLMPARRDAGFLQVARRLFHTEAEILEALGKHSQIPELLAYFENDQEFYLVQEYIKGHPLSEELPVNQRQSESFVINLLKEVLEVLVFIHNHHVLHRDIKPSNIIRREQDNRLVLIDFGAVKQMQPLIQEQTENPTVAIGTRGYAPPEQFAGHPRLSSDIYALGMIAIQAITGVAPYQLQTDLETGNVLWHHLAQVSEEFAVILDKMVCYHFNQRYPSASAVLQDLKRLA